MDIAMVAAPPGVTASAARKTSAARQIPFLNRLAIAVVLALSAVLGFASAASAQFMLPGMQDPSGNSDGTMMPGFPGLNPWGSLLPQFGPSGQIVPPGAFENLGGTGSGDARSDVGEDGEEVEQTDNNNNGDGNNNGGGSGSVRDAPRLALSAQPRRDRTLPLRFQVSGRLMPPEALGVAAVASRELAVDVPAGACNGAVTIAFKARGRTVARRRASVTSTCRFRSGITIDSRRRIGRARRLKATARFGGNELLAPVRRSTTLQIG